MSKKEFKKYIHELSKEQLEEQVLDLYERFKDVKQYYNFAFNPKEDKLLEEAKFKISKEYFPVNGRKAKMRLSVAQKMIREYIRLGVDPYIIADIMLYNLEVALSYRAENFIKADSFYRSMHKSFEVLTDFLAENKLMMEFRSRLEKIVEDISDQNWQNSSLFKI